MHPSSRRPLVSIFSRFAIALAFAGVLLACSPTLAPVLNVDERMSVPSNGAQSVERTRQAIRDGLAAKRWKVDRDEPGRIIATITMGEHQATVRITYTADHYSIHHQESSNGLKYDGTNIHRRYNHWIRLLSQAIDHAAR
jgi:hypothetical protein